MNIEYQSELKGVLIQKTLIIASEKLFFLKNKGIDGAFFEGGEIGLSNGLFGGMSGFENGL